MKLAEIKAWLLERLPDIVTDCELRLTNDEELVVLLVLDASKRSGSEQDSIARYRNETRETRMQLGREMSQRHGYDVSWGMRVGETTQFFTSNMKPVMTRLSAEERRIVDMLIAANIVHTRSAALSYIVRVFAIEHKAWLDELERALAHVEQVRDHLQPEPRTEPPPV